MAKMVISNVEEFNGEYPLEDISLTGHEAHLIKRISGVTVGELKDAMGKGDYDLIVAFAVLAMVRSNRIPRQVGERVAEMLLEAPIGSVDFQGDSPPLAEARKQQNGSADETNAKSNGSSASSNDASEQTPEKTPEPIGSRG